MAGTGLTQMDKSPVGSAFEDLSELIDSEAFVPTKAGEEQKKRVLWQIGSRIAGIDAGDETQTAAVVRSVGAQLNRRYKRGFSGNKLLEARKVYRAFPDLGLLDGIPTWGHCVALAGVRDERTRDFLRRKCHERQWDAYTLESYARQPVDDMWREGRFYDRLVICYAVAYATTCGVISMERLRRIYLADITDPIDEFDFKESLRYMDAHAKRESWPSLQTLQGQPCIVERSLGEAFARERRESGFASSHFDLFEDTYYYRDPYAESSEQARREAFLEELKARRRQRLSYDARMLASRPKQADVKHLDRAEVERGVLSPTMDSRSVVRLLSLLFQPVPSEIDPDTGLTEAEESFGYALARLCRYVSRVGLPSREELEQDALYLTCLAGISHAQETFLALVRDALEGIYRKLPLWKLGGYCQDDLEARPEGPAI